MGALGLFGKKKAIVKPTSTEQEEINKRLAKKYPQMQSRWMMDATDAEKELERRTEKRIKTFKTKRTSQIESELRQAGLSEADIARLRGKK